MSKETHVIICDNFKHFLTFFLNMKHYHHRDERSMVRTHGQSGFCVNEMIGTKKMRNAI